MSLIVPDCGEVEFLSRVVNKNTPADLELRLYTNDVTPGEATVLGDLTESTGTGYAAITLTGASWTVSTTANVTTAEYAQQTFTYTGAEANIYGYYLTSGGVLMWVERFSDGPYSIPSSGGEVKVTPKITGD